jgi:hypothetical protein
MSVIIPSMSHFEILYQLYRHITAKKKGALVLLHCREITNIKLPDSQTYLKYVELLWG